MVLNEFDYEGDPVAYANLWRSSQKCLSIYAQTLDIPSQDKQTVADDADEQTDTCIERIVRIVSSGDKADQMKARRDHTVVYVTNPMMNQ